MENAFIILMVLHIGGGGIALLTGLLAIIFKKAGENHRFVGNIFTLSMAINSVTGVGLAPFTDNYILAAIGLFSAYVVLTGYLLGKNIHVAGIGARLIWLFGVASAVWMFLFMNPIVAVFGAIFSYFLFQDFRRFMLGKQVDHYNKRIQLHLGRMMASYITAVTAFIVVNFSNKGQPQLATYFLWLSPAVILTILIFYFRSKYPTPKKHAASN